MTREGSSDVAEIKRRLRLSYRNDILRRETRGIRPWKTKVLEAFLTRLRPEQRTIADLGAGPGLYAVSLRDRGMAVTCLDLCPEMAARCAAKGLPAVVGDFYALPLRTASLDAIWAMSSLLHVPKAHLVDVLGEIARVLRPGGLCYLGFYRGRMDGYNPNDRLDPPRYFAFYQPDELRANAQHPSLDLIALNVVQFGDIPDDNDGHIGLTMRQKE